MIIYDPDQTSSSLKWIWSVDAAGVYTMTLIFDENAADSEKLVVTTNADNSGWLEWSEWFSSQ